MAFLQRHTVSLVHYCLVTSTPLDNTVAAVNALQMQWEGGGGAEGILRWFSYIGAVRLFSVQSALILFSLLRGLFLLFFFFFYISAFLLCPANDEDAKSYVYMLK